MFKRCENGCTKVMKIIRHWKVLFRTKLQGPFKNCYTNLRSTNRTYIPWILLCMWMVHSLVMTSVKTFLSPFFEPLVLGAIFWNIFPNIEFQLYNNRTSVWIMQSIFLIYPWCFKSTCTHVKFSSKSLSTEKFSKLVHRSSSILRFSYWKNWTVQSIPNNNFNSWSRQTHD